MKEIKYALVDTGGFSSLMTFLKDYLPEACTFAEDEDPDYLICSCFGKSIMKEDAIRIQYIGENLVPDFNVYDYAIGFHFIDFEDRYLRYPLYALAYRKAFMDAAEKHTILTEKLQKKDKFCSFVVSNGREEDIRTQFFLNLSNYKRVESGGRFMNNVGYALKGRDAKTEFQSRCRFAIAFENSSTPGYTTEKLLEAWQAGTIPIYWGNPDIGKEFNSKAFINCHEYGSFDEVIKRVIEIDNNEELYLSIMRQPILYTGCIAERYLDGECLKEFLKRIFTVPKHEAYRRNCYYSRFANYYEQEVRKQENSPRGINRILRKLLK